jgi:hypothetical protein
MNKQERVRNPGKTKKDREAGAAAQNAANKAARAHYDSDSSSKLKDFPWHTCNGKKTRAMIKASHKKH